MNMAVPSERSPLIPAVSPAPARPAETALSLPVSAQPVDEPQGPADSSAVSSAFPEASFAPVDPVVQGSQSQIESFFTFLQRLNAPPDAGYIPLEDSRLKDGLSQYLGQLSAQLAQQPELRDKLAQTEAGQGLLSALDSAAAGRLDSSAIVQIQTFIVASGVDIGYTDNSLGIDGDYGPLTHRGLQQAFSQLMTTPDQALTGLKNERSVALLRDVRASRPAISDVAPSSTMPPPTETNGSLTTTPFQDKNGNPVRLTPVAAQGLSRIYELAKARGIDVRVNSSYRSVEEQTRLWREALSKYGSAEEARRWVAPPGRSRHNSGGAIDMNLMRNGQKIPQSEFDALIREAGMYRPMAWEGWHVEPLGSRG